MEIKVLLEDGPDHAAWAQAILSAIGIVVAAYIAARVADRPILAVRHDRIAALLCIAEAGDERLRRAQILSRAFDAGDLGLVDDLGLWDRVVASIDALPPLDVTPGFLFGYFLGLREDVVLARQIVVGLRAFQTNGVVPANNLGALMNAPIEKSKALLAGLRAAEKNALRRERWWFLP